MAEKLAEQEVKMTVFKCKACEGRGTWMDFSNSVLGPYEPIGFSRRRMAQAARDYENAKRSCRACNGRGFILEEESK